MAFGAALMVVGRDSRKVSSRGVAGSLRVAAAQPIKKRTRPGPLDDRLYLMKFCNAAVGRACFSRIRSRVLRNWLSRSGCGRWRLRSVPPSGISGGVRNGGRALWRLSSRARFRWSSQRTTNCGLMVPWRNGAKAWAQTARVASCHCWNSAWERPVPFLLWCRLSGLPALHEAVSSVGCPAGAGDGVVS